MTNSTSNKLQLNNKADLSKLRALLNEALSLVEEQTGTKIKVGNMTYDADGSRVGIKVEAFSVQEDGSIQTAEMKELLQMVDNPYSMKWLTREDLNKVFKSGGKSFTLTGFKGRSPKYPFQAKCLDDGQNYKFPANAIARAMGKWDQLKDWEKRV